MNLYPLLSLFCVILWIWALVSCIKSENPSKLIWILVIIFLPLLGSILYLALGGSKGGAAR